MKIILLLTVILLPMSLFAVESIPYRDFIALTDNALDSLDELELVISNPNTKVRERNEALITYEAAINKFDRHMSARWNLVDKQKALVEKLQSIQASYGLYLSLRNHDEMYKEKGNREAKEVRELFRQYKWSKD